MKKVPFQETEGGISKMHCTLLCCVLAVQGGKKKNSQQLSTFVSMVIYIVSIQDTSHGNQALTRTKCEANMSLLEASLSHPDLCTIDPLKKGKASAEQNHLKMSIPWVFMFPWMHVRKRKIIDSKSADW